MIPAEVDRICTKCHTETAGPFVCEHAIVKIEGSVACHDPRGSSNQHMLTKAKVDVICLLYHYPSSTSKTGAPVGQHPRLECERGHLNPALEKLRQHRSVEGITTWKSLLIDATDFQSIGESRATH
jgi:hypothetical protein